MFEARAVAPQGAVAPRTHAQTQQLVLQTVAREAEALLRTAQRHSLCADDAHDAYQRSMEIFVRRAPTLDPERAARWLQVVVKHEALALRKRRADVVPPESVDYDLHEAVHDPGPEEQAIGADRTAAAAEALQRLKPQELRAMWLKALGKSYAEICEETGWTHTKVNRCLAEGRKSFLQRFAGIEAGEECERWQPLLSAVIDGEANAAQLAELRPHLRNCPACRATLRGLQESRAPLAAVLPVGLIGAGAKLSGLLERLMPAAAASDAGVAGGGAGLLGLGGTKLAGLVAAGAAATAAGGGGLVVAHEHHVGAKRVRPVSGERTAARRADLSASLSASAGVSAVVTGAAGRSEQAGAAVAERDAAGRARAAALRLRARRHESGRLEFAPAGGETADAPTPAPNVTLARLSAPGPAGSGATPAPSPVPAAPAPTADSTTGEFAPRP